MTRKKYAHKPKLECYSVRWISVLPFSHFLDSCNVSYKDEGEEPSSANPARMGHYVLCIASSCDWKRSPNRIGSLPIFGLRLVHGQEKIKLLEDRCAYRPHNSACPPLYDPHPRHPIHLVLSTKGTSSITAGRRTSNWQKIHYFCGLGFPTYFEINSRIPDLPFNITRGDDDDDDDDDNFMRLLRVTYSFLGWRRNEAEGRMVPLRNNSTLAWFVTASCAHDNTVSRLS